MSTLIAICHLTQNRCYSTHSSLTLGRRRKSLTPFPSKHSLFPFCTTTITRCYCYNCILLNLYFPRFNSPIQHSYLAVSLHPYQLHTSRTRYQRQRIMLSPPSTKVLRSEIDLHPISFGKSESSHINLWTATPFKRELNAESHLPSSHYPIVLKIRPDFKASQGLQQSNFASTP